MEKKIAAVLDEALPIGKALNALGHLAVSLGYFAKDHMGRPKLPDASGFIHAGISKYPFIVLKTKAEKVKELYYKAKQAGLIAIGFPEEMYTTYTDDELASAMKKAAPESLKFYGFVVYGKTEKVNEVTGKLELWK